MNFKDLTKTEQDLTYQEGFREGYLLAKSKWYFLRDTTLEMLGHRKYQKEYQRLFN